jgi:hypothetical protein
MREHSSTTHKAKLITWIEDLELLASFYTARFIVWRALRHEREQRQGLGPRNGHQAAKSFGVDHS